MTHRTRKILWARSGNRCAKCRCVLVQDSTERDDDVVVGEECHIYAQGVEGPRSCGPRPAEIDHHSNLLLLCGSCHTIVDAQEQTFSIEHLIELKRAHEQWVTEALGNGLAQGGEECDAQPQNEWGDLEVLPPGRRSEDLFEERLADAFPGTAGLVVCDNHGEALERLEIVLRRPLVQTFPNADGSSRSVEPFWWFRGGSCMHIENFDRLDQCHGLLGIKELKVTKVAAYRTRCASKRDFLYVETTADPPTGVYPVPGPADMSRAAQSIGGYFYEEYAIWNDRPISRRDYDDRATLVDGRPQRVLAAELRQRFLTPYNFVVCGNRHVINESANDSTTLTILNGILRGTSTLEDLVRFVERLRVPSRYLVD